MIDGVATFDMREKNFEEELTVLSDRDRDLLVKFLHDSPDPIPALSDAYKKISKLSRIDENRNAVYHVGSSLIVKSESRSGRQ